MGAGLAGNFAPRSFDSPVYFTCPHSLSIGVKRFKCVPNKHNYLSEYAPRAPRANDERHHAQRPNTRRNRRRANHRPPTPKHKRATPRLDRQTCRLRTSTKNMPRKTQWQVCSYDLCPEIVQGKTRCPAHPTLNTLNEQRPSGTQRGWTRHWASFRTGYLQRHPFCNCDDCKQIPIRQRPPSTDIDHSDGHSRTCAHATDEQHLVAMSHAHHSYKTATQDTGAQRTPRCPPLPQFNQHTARERRSGGSIQL